MWLTLKYKIIYKRYFFSQSWSLKYYNYTSFDTSWYITNFTGTLKHKNLSLFVFFFCFWLFPRKSSFPSKLRKKYFINIDTLQFKKLIEFKGLRTDAQLRLIGFWLNRVKNWSDVSSYYKIIFFFFLADFLAYLVYYKYF